MLDAGTEVNEALVSYQISKRKKDNYENQVAALEKAFTSTSLLMQHGNEVLLSQRPPVGLWGGLFCFPQFEEEAALREWLAERGIKDDNLTQLTAFRHTFSHFHLDIVPMWLTVHSSGACMDEGNALWYNLAQPPSVGLAAPVERLLQQLKAGAPV